MFPIFVFFFTWRAFGCVFLVVSWSKWTKRQPIMDKLYREVLSVVVIPYANTVRFPVDSIENFLSPVVLLFHSFNQGSFCCYSSESWFEFRRDSSFSCMELYCISCNQRDSMLVPSVPEVPRGTRYPLTTDILASNRDRYVQYRFIPFLYHQFVAKQLSS